MRSIEIAVSDHDDRISNSSNGLVLYSDLHRCDEGILAINNAYVDLDFAVRSFSSIELPDKRNPSTKSLPGLPMPQIRITQTTKEYLITQMLPKKSLRLIIEDSRLDAIIKIGRIPKKEKPIAVAESDQGSIVLDYYPSKMEYNTNMEKWFNILVNQLELLPVTRLGLFVETLRFIHSFYRSPPDAFQIKQLQTILSSHETYFKTLIDLSEGETLGTVGAKYGKELEILAIKILDVLKENPKFNLKEIALKLDWDLIHLIYTLLIMEQEGFIEIQRPVIVDKK